MTNHQKGLAFAHLAAVLFGMTGILGALIQMDASLITFGRASLAFISLYLYSRLVGISLKQHLSLFFIGRLLFSGVLLAIHWVTFFYAVKIGGVAMATLGFASFPAFITLIERFILRDKVNKTAWGLVFIVMFGLFLVSPELTWHNANSVGLVWGIISGLSFAGLAVVNRTMGHQLSAISISFWQNLIVAFVTLPALWFISLSMTGSDGVYLLILSVICTALSHVLFVSSVKYIPARITGLIISLEPVYAIAVAWWLFNEQPTLKMIIGGILIIGAAVYPYEKAAHSEK
ncbi:DMT family transporter [Lonepinella sp. BR2919]|uniref:DMT family transporter n=1 Tax=unclassified Lonepinella TaxID=2642006 RepID=UPI003F6E3A4B